MQQAHKHHHKHFSTCILWNILFREARAAVEKSHKYRVERTQRNGKHDVMSMSIRTLLFLCHFCARINMWCTLQVQSRPNVNACAVVWTNVLIFYSFGTHIALARIIFVSGIRSITHISFSSHRTLKLMEANRNYDPTESSRT